MAHPAVITKTITTTTKTAQTARDVGKCNSLVAFVLREI
jgi:hypothetical protein